MKLDFDDILIKPASVSQINSRSQVNIYNKQKFLPLFTAPMDTVVSIDNADQFINNHIRVILPRRKFDEMDLGYVSINPNVWFSYGLNEFREIFLENTPDTQGAKMYALIDVANGHMPSLLSAVWAAKNKYNSDLVLMVGNVANPETYLEYSIAGADYVRIGIGNGGGCLTTVQTGVGYPMASLIQEIYNISLKLNNRAKIVADGGFKKYSDIIKALALGADYVMLGSIFNKALESIGDTYYANKKHDAWTEPGEKVDQFDPHVADYFRNGGELYKKFRGMSTKEVQVSWGKTDVKTSEGIVKMQKVEYTLSGWVENFSHYLKSAMSYTSCFNMEEFVGGPECIQISRNSFERYNK